MNIIHNLKPLRERLPREKRVHLRYHTGTTTLRGQSILWEPGGRTTHLTLASLTERKLREAPYLMEKLSKQKARRNYTEPKTEQTARTGLRRQEGEMVVFAGQIF